MKKLFFIIIVMMIASPIFSQDTPVKKIAVLETVDTEKMLKQGDLMRISNTIARLLKKYTDYKLYERKNVSAIIDEHEFQKTDIVNKKQRKELQMAGVDYVLYTEIAPSVEGIYILGKVLDLETGEWVMDGDATVESAHELKDGFSELLRDMLGESNGSKSNNNTYNPIRGRDYVENVLDLDMKMVWVEGGEFLMGDSTEVYSNEQFIRWVKLDSYYIAETEVTQAQWEAVMGTTIQDKASKAGATSYRGVGLNHPMYYVNWYEAQDFCRELSRRTGRTYVLPTEAQWEYAARGGKNDDGTKYSGSYSIDNVAWYDDNSGSTHKVKTKDHNSLGLYDMSGNVYEWCSDWYGDYNSNYATNPTGPSSGSCRVRRGGSWDSGARDCRVSVRLSYSPDARSNGLGFRVVAVP